MKKIPLTWLGAGASLLVVAGLIAFAYLNPVHPSVSSDTSSASWTASSTSADTTLAPAPAGEKRYTSTRFHFSLLYPDDLAVNEFFESSGALTVTFKKEDGTNAGFQIYATPYSDTQITAARFKLDEPSGVMKNQTDILVDGTQASMFFSNNISMGDTREVWFIKNGILYEVTTYKELDSWLAGIMQTWKFL